MDELHDKFILKSKIAPDFRVLPKELDLRLVDTTSVVARLEEQIALREVPFHIVPRQANTLQRKTLNH